MTYELSGHLTHQLSKLCCAYAATAALETLQQLVKEQNAALGKLKVQAQEQAANARRLQERYDTADRFAQMLRCETNCVKDQPCSAGCISSVLSYRWMLITSSEHGGKCCYGLLYCRPTRCTSTRCHCSC